MIILVTHVLVWWASGSDLLSARASKAIQKTLTQKREVIVSSISAWESHAD